MIVTASLLPQQPGPKMVFGPWPTAFPASGAPTNATRTSRMMKIPLATATLSCLKRIQTSSQ